MLQLQKARDHMATLGFYPAGDAPVEFTNVMRADLEKWECVIRNLSRM